MTNQKIIIYFICIVIQFIKFDKKIFFMKKCILQLDKYILTEKVLYKIGLRLNVLVNVIRSTMFD